MPKPLGAPKSGGRKPGVPNKRTDKVQKAIEAQGITPLEYLLSVMRDVVNEPKERAAAAIAAAPYVHARLSSVEVNANVTNHESALDELK